MRYFSTSLFFLALIVYFPLINKAQPSDHPNIVLMVADDHGLDALGCYGNPVIQTPNLDQLAQEGVRFNKAYCTSASCAASRSVLLTGKYGHATGAYGHTHDYHHFSTYNTVKSLPVMLEDAGYATARIGKYHLAPESVYHFQQVLKADPRNTVEMAEACEDFLNQEDPFFLYFCTDDPHRDFPFTPKEWHLPNSFGNREEGFTGVEAKKYQPEEVIVPSFLPDNQITRKELAEYYQSVSRIDQGVGRLMDLLTKAGKDKNTIVIYISDNGIAFPGAKTTLYEAGIKLPCIVKLPDHQQYAGTQTEAMISWVDMTPTILKWAGVGQDPENKFHGRSFHQAMLEQNPEGWDEIKASHTFHEITMYYPMRVFRKGDLKLIWNIVYRTEYPFASDLWASSTWQNIYRDKKKMFGPRKLHNYLFRPEFELYDLNNDPDEVHNLAYKRAFKSTLEAMKTAMKQFQQETNDPWKIMWDHDASLQGEGVGL